MLGAAAFSMSGIKALRAMSETDFGVNTSIEQVMRLIPVADYRPERASLADWLAALLELLQLLRGELLLQEHEAGEKVLGALWLFQHLPLGVQAALGRAYAAWRGFARNRLAMLVETHSWKDYPTRVRVTRNAVVSVLAQVGAHGPAWLAAAQAADARATRLGGTEVVLVAVDQQDLLRLHFTDKSHQQIGRAHV